MKRRTKIGLVLAAAGFGAIALSGCTASFCSTIDIARMKYAFEPGITRIEKSDVVTDYIEFKGENYNYKITGAKLVVAEWVPDGDIYHVGKFIFQEGKEKYQTKYQRNHVQIIGKFRNYWGHVLLQFHKKIEV